VQKGKRKKKGDPLVCVVVFDADENEDLDIGGRGCSEGEKCFTYRHREKTRRKAVSHRGKKELMGDLRNG